MRTHPMLLATALLVTACGDKTAQEPEEVQATMVEVFPNLPVPPEGQMISQEGAGAAMQMTFSSPQAGDSMANYYREILSRPPYELINESVNNDVVSFFVEQNGPSMWVVVQGLEAGGSLVTLAGARARAGTAADSVRILQGTPVNPDSITGAALPIN